MDSKKEKLSAALKRTRRVPQAPQNQLSAKNGRPKLKIYLGPASPAKPAQPSPAHSPKMYPKSLNLRKPKSGRNPKIGPTKNIFDGSMHPYNLKMALAWEYPVEVSRFSPNPYSQLPRNMSKIGHVENSEIQHPGRKKKIPKTIVSDTIV